MSGIKKGLLGVLAVAIAAVIAASFWFWITPVGVNNYINKVSIQLATDSPELLTRLGLIDNTLLDFHSGKLADYTKEGDERSLEKLRQARAGLDRYGPEGLEGQELLSWKIAAWLFDDWLIDAEMEYNGYRVNQISGVTVNLPEFLTDAHAIVDRRSADRYLSRLTEFGRVLREVKDRVVDDQNHGVIPPDFVIEKSLAGMRQFIAEGAAQNVLVTDFGSRLSEVAGINAEDQALLVSDAQARVASEVIPGYEGMIALFEELATQTNHDAGIWRIPNGDAIYRHRLRSSTTTDYTPEQVHEIGLSEVVRIEGEMHAILDAQQIPDGDIATRVRVVMEDPTQQFANTDEGREEMIAYLESFDEKVMARVADFFITIPPQPLEIVRVPVHAQDSSAGGYYSSPALDGSRPGRFYINQKSTADNPRWTLPTLMIHEGSPGHHFQLSASQLIEDVPLLRKLSPFNAFTEGWALYSERIAKTDMGLYDDDPLGDLGRLQAEMFRAVRLVVDTGIHAKRWSREEAIEYMLAKTGMTEDEVTREIERYSVWPGQATGYKTGQLAILELRETAEEALGESFDIRQFHELLLMNGAMPLALLKDQVTAWVDQQQ
ncbi:MAG: DUF885 domain-containing protein [Luminiphilus sp.]|nr:DUF885 domain-containing protein [Luminiphilus sp.]